MVLSARRRERLRGAGVADVAQLLARLHCYTHSDARRDAAQVGVARHQAATVVVGDVVCYLPLAGLVDLEAERKRLVKNLDEIEGRIAHSEKLLAGEFAQKAPEHIVQRERDKLADLQTEQAKLKERLAAVG